MSAATVERNRFHSESPKSSSQVRLGDRALDVLDRYRQQVGESLYVSELESEFATLGRELGGLALYIAGCDTNKAGAFKVRGMLHAMHEETDPSTSIVIPSAGNAARGAVVASHYLDRSLTAVVPTSAPVEKKEGLQVLRSELERGNLRTDKMKNNLTVMAQGETFDQSLHFAKRLALATNAYLLHPYDNEYVIAGQGTIVDDLNRVSPDFDTIVTPTGGGGLLSGLVSRLKELNQDATVFAVEAEGSDSMSRSLRAGRVVEAKKPNQLYGGSAVRKCGEVCLRKLLDVQYDPNNVIRVSDREIAQVATDYLSDRSELLVTTEGYEPTTLTALAGLQRLALQGRLGKKTVVLGTGHNAPIDSLFPKTAARRCHIASGPMER